MRLSDFTLTFSLSWPSQGAEPDADLFAHLALPLADVRGSGHAQQVVLLPGRRHGGGV